MQPATLRPLLILGAGGFAREAAEAVRAANADRPTWDLLGFLDDDERFNERRVDGVPVLGPIDTVEQYPDAYVVICIGNPRDYWSRIEIVRRLGLESERWATIVHPAAVLPTSVQVGHGTVVLAGVVATTGVRIGAHVSVMPRVVFTHDDRVGDFAILASGVLLGGEVEVEAGAYIGAGAMMRERVRIGRSALVGMGAVVLGDVPAGEVWAGVPARRLRSVSVPNDILSGAPKTDAR